MSSRLNQEFTINPLGFARAYVMQPSDFTVKVALKQRTVVGMDAPPGPDPLTNAPRLPRVSEQKYQSVASTDRVVFGDFVPGDAMSGTLGAQVLMMRTDYAAGHFPLFWLPYAQNEARKITLKDRRGDDKEIRRTGGEARAFFTTAVNGCTIFIEGSLEHPTVYHLNGADIARLDTSKPPTEDQLHDSKLARTFGMEDRWQGIRQPSNMDPAKFAQQTAAPSASLHAGNYLPNYFGTESGRMGQDAAETHYLTVACGLLGVAPTDVIPINTKHSACVFGYKSKTTGHWEFWYQQRAWIRLADRSNPAFDGSAYVNYGVKKLWPGVGDYLFARSTHRLHSFYVLKK